MLIPICRVRINANVNEKRISHTRSPLMRHCIGTVGVMPVNDNNRIVFMESPFKRVT